MIEVRCPQCGREAKAPDEAAGKRTTCPKCGAIVQVPSQPPIVHAARFVEAEAVEVAPPQGGGKRLGIASLLLGLLSLPLAYLPTTGLLVAVLGLLLGGIGFVLALTRGGRGIGYVIGGGTLCSLGLVCSLISMLVLSIAAPFQEIDLEFQKSEQQAAEETEKAKSQPAVAWGQPAEIGGARLTLVSAKIMEEEGKKHLFLDTLLENQSHDKQIEFLSPNHAFLGTGKGRMWLRDEFGGEYWCFGPFNKDSMPEGFAQLLPGDSISQMYRCDLPSEKAQSLTFWFPNKTVGGQGITKFEIPRQQISDSPLP